MSILCNLVGKNIVRLGLKVKVLTRRIMQKNLPIFLIFFIITITGCSSRNSSSPDTAIVRTYAELTLLYEKEKMANKISDSLYQIKVKDFFAGRNLYEDNFRNEVDFYLSDGKSAKIFLAEVTGVLDSIARRR
jgi:hypothetical protein